MVPVYSKNAQFHAMLTQITKGRRYGHREESTADSQRACAFANKARTQVNPLQTRTKTTMGIAQRFKLALLGAAMLASGPAPAAVDPSIAACLKAWGTHPFGTNPRYKTLSTSVKVFGIGDSPIDAQATSTPTLVLVNTGVNVMGGATLELLNPNGWYCFKSNVNVMGSLKIRAACKAHLASARDGTTVLGSNADNKSVTVLGATQVELVGCK